MEYVIGGDKDGTTCLVYVCGKDIKSAKKCLVRMLGSPTENDKYLMKNLTNFRIVELEDEDCWWNFNCD